MWYGGGIFQPYGDIASPFDRLARINCPVMGFFANKDKMCTIDHVDGTEAELKRLGKDYRFYRYDADHAFASYHDERYEEFARDQTPGPRPSRSCNCIAVRRL